MCHPGQDCKLRAGKGMFVDFHEQSNFASPRFTKSLSLTNH